MSCHENIHGMWSDNIYAEEQNSTNIGKMNVINQKFTHIKYEYHKIYKYFYA